MNKNKLPQTQSKAKQSEWLALSSGFITASGAPSKKGLTLWRERACTDLVTLQRTDEIRPGLPRDCQELGMRWWHRPLSGRRLEAPGDREVLAQIPEFLKVLQETPPRRIVIHCSAGLHRTGVYLYLLLRYAGFKPEQCLEEIRRARPLTADELERCTKKSGVLFERAESFFVDQSGVSNGSESSKNPSQIIPESGSTSP